MSTQTFREFLSTVPPTLWNTLAVDIVIGSLTLEITDFDGTFYYTIYGSFHHRVVDYVQVYILD